MPDPANHGCLGAGRPGWNEHPTGEDSERIGMLEPGYAPGSSWDPQFAPAGPLAGDMLRPERFTQPQCNAHWRPIPRFHEFQALLALKATERPLRLAEIQKQHHGSTSKFSLARAFVPLIVSARLRCGGDGSVDDALRVFPLIMAGGLEIDRVLFAQKCLYNRARAYQFFPELDPPFCPAHPSYPSGHSTQAHGLAYFLDAGMDVPGDPHRGERDKAVALAFRIAENREVAGVHFRSDTQAGMKLARELVDEILAHPKMAANLAALRGLFTP